jgi:hypothetical protein
MDEHAGFEETSRLMFLRPELVSPVYRELPAQTTNNPVEFFKVAGRDGWLGYLSSPRLANANYGARLQQYRSKRDNALPSPSSTASWTSETSRDTQNE